MPPTSEPIRLRVSYKSPESLLQAFTLSLGRGEVELPSQRDLPLGTRFLFELVSEKLWAPVSVQGEVVRVAPAKDGAFTLTVRYALGRDRSGLDGALRMLFDEHQQEKVRRHPRVPVHISVEETAGGLPYLIKDISKGGVGLTVASVELPEHLKPGMPALIEVDTANGPVGLHGSVAWVKRPKDPSHPASLGIRFGRLAYAVELALDRLLVLYGLPSGPWRAKVSFGMDAVARMP